MYADRTLVFAVLTAGLIVSAVFFAAVWITGADGLLSTDGHMLVVRDYLWLWAAGHLLAAGDVATIFDPQAFAAWNRARYSAQLDDFVWSYPPSLLFLALPAGRIPILAGFVLFASAQLALLACIGRLARLPGRVLLAVLVSPAVLANAFAGQNGALTAALLCGGLLLAGRRPVLSGVLLGLLTIKPQLGILVPICLLASRDWKAIGAACATAAALFAASVAAFGFESWVLFWENTRPYMTGIMQADWQALFYQRITVTAFMAMRALGAGLAASYACQLIAGIAAITVAWRIWRRPAIEPAARAAVTMCLALLATPYGYTYDMVGTAIAVATLANTTKPPATAERVILTLAWLWPAVAPAFGNMGLQPVGVLLIAGVACAGCHHLSPSIHAIKPVDPKPRPDEPHVAFKPGGSLAAAASVPASPLRRLSQSIRPAGGR